MGLGGDIRHGSDSSVEELYHLLNWIQSWLGSHVPANRTGSPQNGAEELWLSLAASLSKTDPMVSGLASMGSKSIIYQETTRQTGAPMFKCRLCPGFRSLLGRALGRR